MTEIEKARAEIDRIDGEMARLFAARMDAVRAIAGEKRAQGLPVRDPVREEEMLAARRAAYGDAETEPYYVRFLRGVIDLSCSFQTRLAEGLRVAYSGVEGAFAWIAAKKLFPDGVPVACPDFAAAYRAAESGEAACAVLPLENSYAGEVGAVMDLLFAGGLYVNRVIEMPVTHCLIARPGVTADAVKTVISHPQALAQCAAWTRGRGLETRPCPNTALAAREVAASDDRTLAAIASEETAALFGLEVLARGINDSPANTTRFAVFSPVRARPAALRRREDNFILVYTVRNEAGALALTLDIIGSHGYNLRALRSRPMKDLQWKYYFYVEAEGDINCAEGENMLRELAPLCGQLRLIGSYPAADAGD